MSALHVSPALAACARNRFYNWQEAGFPHIDEGMFGILIMLNKLPGVTTLFCCTGHEDVDRFYVMCVVSSEEGQEFLSDIFVRWRASLLTFNSEDEGIPYFPELQISYASSIFEENGFTQDYPSWTFSSYYNSHEDGERVLKAFRQALLAITVSRYERKN